MKVRTYKIESQDRETEIIVATAKKAQKRVAELNAMGLAAQMFKVINKAELKAIAASR